MFDDWGRYRTVEYFDEDGQIYMRRDGEFERKLSEGKLTTRVVNATGTINLPTEPDVNGDVENAVEMMHRLEDPTEPVNRSFGTCFDTLMGRNEMLSDSITLVEAERAYVESNGSFKSLVVALLSSDSFLYRR